MVINVLHALHGGWKWELLVRLGGKGGGGWRGAEVGGNKVAV